MTSRLDLLNDTLDVLGERPAVSATITSTTSDWIRRAERQLDRAAKLVSEKHDWNWLTTIEQLSETDNDDVIGWEFEFTKPANCKRIRKVTIDGGWYSRPLPFEDRSGTILTNSETCFLHFVDDTRLALMGAWPEVFAFAVATEAAWRACAGSTKSQAQKDQVKTDRKEAIADAKTWDGQQQPAKPRYAGSFVRAISGAWKGRENG